MLDAGDNTTDEPQIDFSQYAKVGAIDFDAVASKEQSKAQAIQTGASKLGIDPIDYATAMHYESAGTFDPWQKGPVTKWGQHRGTIQYGEPQQKQYGVYPGQPFEDQVTDSNVRYLKDHGVRPGMGFEQVYKAINGGTVSANSGTPDANTGRTISDNIRNAQNQSRPTVLARFGHYFGQTNPSQTDFSSYAEKSSPQIDFSQYSDAPNTPVPESPDTINQQVMSALNTDSPKSAVVTTDPPTHALVANSPAANSLIPVPQPDGKMVWWSKAKAAKVGVTNPQQADAFIKVHGLAGIIGKVDDVGDNTGLGQPAVQTTAPDGTELSSSIVKTPESAQTQAAVDQQAFPGSESKLVDSADVIKDRILKNASFEPIPTTDTQQVPNLTPQPQPQIPLAATPQAAQKPVAQSTAAVPQRQATQPPDTRQYATSEPSISDVPETSLELQQIPRSQGTNAITEVVKASPTATPRQILEQLAPKYDLNVDKILTEHPSVRLDLGSEEPDSQGNVHFTVTAGLIGKLKAWSDTGEEAARQKAEALASPTDEAYRQKAIEELTNEKRAAGLNRFDRDAPDSSAQNLNLTEDEIQKRIAEFKAQELTLEAKSRAYDVAQKNASLPGSFLSGLYGGAGSVIHTAAGVLRPFSAVGLPSGYASLSELGKEMQSVSQYRNAGQGSKNAGESIAGFAGESIPSLAEMVALPGGAIGKFAFLGAAKASGTGAPLREVGKGLTEGAITGKAFKSAEIFENPLARLGTVFGGSIIANQAVGVPLAQNVHNAILNTMFQAVGDYGPKVLDKTYRFWKGDEPVDVQLDDKGEVLLDPVNPNRHVDGEIVLDPENKVYQNQAERRATAAVPTTEAEPEKAQYTSVLDEIRQKNLTTKGQIQAEFPQLSREEAADLRRQAWDSQPVSPTTQDTVPPKSVTEAVAGGMMGPPPKKEEKAPEPHIDASPETAKAILNGETAGFDPQKDAEKMANILLDNHEKLNSNNVDEGPKTTAPGTGKNGGASDKTTSLIDESVATKPSDKSTSKIPATEGEQRKGERALPKTLEAAQLEKGDNTTYEPATIKSGLERGRQVIAEKGIDGAKEFVRTGNGIEWAPTGFAVMEHQKAEIDRIRATDSVKADELYKEHQEFVGRFAEDATKRGQSIAGIKAVEEFAPDRMEYLLNKVAQKAGKKGLSPQESTYITKVGKELEALKARGSGLDEKLDRSTKETERRAGKVVRKETYLDALEKSSNEAKAAIIARLSKLDFSGLHKEKQFEGQKGAIGERKKLEGDAELLAQYAAGRLHKLDTVEALNKELIDTFGKDIEPHLPDIRQRAYQIRQDARLAALESKDTAPEQRRTIIQDIKAELKKVNDDLTAQQKASAAQRKEVKQETDKFQTAEARQTARGALAEQKAKDKRLIDEARQKAADYKKSLIEARAAEEKGYRAEIKAKRQADKQAAFWDTPLRNMADEARTRLKSGAENPDVMSDLASVGAERWLREKGGGVPGKRAISPSQFYRAMKEEFPGLVTDKNKEEVYRDSYQRIQDAVIAARDASKLSSASKEVQALWEKEGVDVNTQALLIEKANNVRRQMDLRNAAANEFNRVSQSTVKRVGREILNAPRSLMTSLNMHQGRQGLFTLFTHPIKISAKISVPATIKGFAAHTREDFVRLTEELKASPGYALAEEAGLNFAELPKASTDLKGHIEEDQLQSSITMKLPWVRRSTQGFVLGMNAERLALFNLWATVGEANGYTFESNPEFFKTAASVANDFTGRGVAPEVIEQVIKKTNQLFFAPRLKISQVKAVNDLFNPLKYFGSRAYDPVMRKIMAKEALRTIAGATVAYTTLIALGGKGTDDPDDPDFFKVKFGHTHYDMTGGAGATFAFAYKFFKSVGQYVAGIKQDEYHKPLAIASSFFRKKLAPWPGAAIDYFSEKNAVGQPANLKIQAPAKMVKENIALKMVLPMIVSEITDGVEDDGWKGVAKTAPASVFGVTEQTYAPSVRAAQKALADATKKGNVAEIQQAQADLRKAQLDKQEQKKGASPWGGLGTKQNGFGAFK